MCVMTQTFHVLVCLCVCVYMNVYAHDHTHTRTHTHTHAHTCTQKRHTHTHKIRKCAKLLNIQMIFRHSYVKKDKPKKTLKDISLWGDILKRNFFSWEETQKLFRLPHPPLLRKTDPRLIFKDLTTCNSVTHLVVPKFFERVTHLFAPESVTHLLAPKSFGFTWLCDSSTPQSFERERNHSCVCPRICDSSTCA